MLSFTLLNGHQAVALENESLKVTVLPGKGADITGFLHKPSGIDVLMKTPRGLLPPGDRSPTDFLENYEGGWQELFPSANDACTVSGVSIPFHGEVALLPWEWEVVQDEEDEGCLRLQVHTKQTPFRLERVMRLRKGSATLQLEERVTNLSDEAAEFMWGQHLVLGAPFLEAGCTVELSARAIETPDEAFEPARIRLAPGQRSTWPMARGTHPAELVDLRRVPGPEARGHDDAYLGHLERGEWSVTNPRLGLRFGLTWDAGLFRWIVMWMPYGGAEMPPLTGIYGLGLEPWVTRYNLAQAIERGEAVRLGGRGTLATQLSATLTSAR